MLSFSQLVLSLTAGIWSKPKVDNSFPSIVWRALEETCSDLRSQDLFS